MSKGTTLCFGRFLIDLPEGAHIKEMGQQSSFLYGDIYSEPFEGGAEGFKNKMALREADARAGKNQKNHKFDKVIPTSIPNTRIIITRDDNVFGRVFFQLEMYHWADGILFSMNEGPYDRNNIGPAAHEIETAIVARLRRRARDEIPTEPGFCIKDGFIADDGRTEHFEEAHMQINFLEWPDVWVSVFSQTVPKAGDESLLTRVYKVPETPLERAYIRTLRRGKREVNGFKGEELLDLLPTPDAIKQHYFHWEALGNVKDIFVPLLDLDLETATRPMKGPRPRPSLSDDQAIKLYDTILSTVRLRPTSAPVKTKANEPPKKPLGERAATGRTCPQTGWWKSEDEGVVAEWRRRHFNEGDVLPMARRRGQPNLWQKVKGEQPVDQFATVWRLEEYGEAPQGGPESAPKQASASPDGDVGSEAGPSSES
ncbi:MAG: T6SS immunity protein Tli4 family protein [Pseudomonadota bacterium]